MRYSVCAKQISGNNENMGINPFDFIYSFKKSNTLFFLPQQILQVQL